MRISRTDMLKGMAILVSQRGTCSRLQVGAVISRDGRILTTGYNGAPKGLPHCVHPRAESIQEGKFYEGQRVKVGFGDELEDGIITLVTDAGCKVATHAEQNAIAFAARHGLALDGAEMHVTHMPCLSCARSIINAGIRSVTYEIPYRLTEGVELLTAAGIKVLTYPADKVV